MQTLAAVLDVDGTLVDSNDAHARAWVEAFAEAGVPVGYDEVRRSIGMGGDKLMPRVAGIEEDTPRGRRISERRGEIFKTRYLPHVRPFPRVRDLVHRFVEDGFTVVVASSAKEDELAPLLERAGVADLITSRTSSEDADNSKPDPDIVAAALKQSGAPRGAAIMLGDTPYDVEAAIRAGIAIAGVESGGWTREALSGAVAVYADAADLYERYEESPFARLARNAATSSPPTDLTGAAMIGAAVAGIALVGLTLRAIRQRREPPHRAPLAEDDPEAALRRYPGLGPRDRSRLRRIIARTS